MKTILMFPLRLLATFVWVLLLFSFPIWLVLGLWIDKSDDDQPVWDMYVKWMSNLCEWSLN